MPDLDMPPSLLQTLKDMPRKHDFLVGVDSDGCVFDTMELKHKECFIPCTILVWGLQPIAGIVRKYAEQVNLYSQTRGLNRFKALIHLFNILESNTEVKERIAFLPDTQGLRNWVKDCSMLGESSLREEYARTASPSLGTALRWTQTVNDSVKRMMQNIVPIPHAKSCLEAIAKQADVVVVSAADSDTLIREWSEHDLLDPVTAVAGQETGSKAESLRLARGEHYAPDHVLMIGDAPGDLNAAIEAGALFYPIIPGREMESWERLHRVALQRFFNLSYAGKYEKALVDEFMTSLSR